MIFSYPKIHIFIISWEQRGSDNCGLLLNTLCRNNLFPCSVRKCDKLAGDASVMTYKGHRVLQTAIRCRFSPTVTTGNVSDYLITVVRNHYSLLSDTSTLVQLVAV